MDEEINSKQEEARRILDAIRQKDPLAKDQEGKAKTDKVIQRLPSQDAAELEALITTTILSKTPPPQEEKEEEEVINLGEISPISNEQIKTMRSFAATKAAAPPITKIFAEFVIRTYFEFVAWITPTSRVQRCHKEGHLCVNCGMKIPFIQPPGKEEENESGSSTPVAKKHT